MQRVSDRERHVRWNWEKSPDSVELVRYHLIIIDNKDREGIMRRITEQLQQWGDLIEIRSIAGKVVGSRYRYLFRSYDTQTAPRMIDWTKIRKPIKYDSELRERKIGNIEDYVAELYGN